MRDGACLATASCVLTFPEQCRGQLPVLYPLWIRQLDDNVWSVRAHAALALADVVRAYQQDALDVVLPHLRYSIPCANPCANPCVQSCVYPLCPTLVSIPCANPCANPCVQSYVQPSCPTLVSNPSANPCIQPLCQTFMPTLVPSPCVHQHLCQSLCQPSVHIAFMWITSASMLGLCFGFA